MRIRQLGSTIGSTDVRQYLTTYLINDSVAIDAGCLGLLSPVASQRSVKHLFLSHSHLDHLATLPTFLDNVFQSGDDCPTIYASRDVWDCLHRDMFNDRLWPDLARLGKEGIQFYHEAELSSEVPVSAGGLTITPVTVDHTVSTLGFLIEDEYSAVIIASDTGPTDRLWEVVENSPSRQKLRMVFLECSFPNDFEWLAEKSKHLCPKLFSIEIAKLSPTPPFQTVAVHLKAMLEESIRTELEALQIPNLQIGGQDATWKV